MHPQVQGIVGLLLCIPSSSPSWIMHIQITIPFYEADQNYFVVIT